MIPADVIERAREAARKVRSDWAVPRMDLPVLGADAALRSLLADLREQSQFAGYTDTALPGWESAQRVIDDLLRELEYLLRMPVGSSIDKEPLRAALKAALEER